MIVFEEVEFVARNRRAHYQPNVNLSADRGSIYVEAVFLEYFPTAMTKSHEAHKGDDEDVFTPVDPSIEPMVACRSDGSPIKMQARLGVSVKCVITKHCHMVIYFVVVIWCCRHS